VGSIGGVMGWHCIPSRRALSTRLKTLPAVYNDRRQEGFAASIRNHVVSRPLVLTWMRRTFAGAFVALGAKLALADR